jgi:hypothetical protein
LGVLAGCGDSNGPDHASATDAGHSSVTGDALLGDDSAGNACESGSDACWPKGTCAKQLTGGAAFSLLAAPLSVPDGYCTAECSNDAECGAHGLCFGRGLLGEGGECRRACQTNADCRDGYECAKAAGADADAGTLDLGLILPNSCQPLPPTDHLPRGLVGKSCEKDADCGHGYCAESTNSQKGYCTGLCIADSDCGSKGQCVRGPYGSGGTCHETCKVDSDCQNDANGWGCGAGLCVREPNPLADGAVGQACDNDTAAKVCGGGSCRVVGYSGEHYPGGYCVGPCDEDSDCGAHGVCINRLTCLLGCSEDEDCRPEYECRTHPQAPSEATVCYPKD